MMDDPLLGRQLANFRIERVIGRGGMAQVYYGQDVKLERPVAIKLIDSRHQDNPTYAERFVREAKVVAAWRHEHIVQIHYADDEDGLYYFVMEYIDGPDLGKLMSSYAAEGQLMPAEEVVRIGQSVADALDYAHQQGVIHRDVKPSNVMVAEDGRVILTDFGLAMDVQRGSFGEVFGTPHYIAPEQARRSADAVPQSDLYSLGVILYEMLTGVVPFDDPSPTTVAVQHMTQPPPSPREINPDISPETEAVLLGALSKGPEERYQTGRELMEALAQTLGVELAGVREPSSEWPVALAAAANQVEKPSPDRAKAPTVGREEVEPEGPPGSEPAAPDADTLLGQQLDEYQLDSLLGKGGMAGVYKALDARLKRFVAIKVIDAPFRADSDYQARFEREAQAIAQLEHPHIVRLYRYGEANGLLYMAMQYIEGINLHTHLADYKKEDTFMPPAEASRIIRQVCRALDYAHSRGVIHRDVKPSNVMLDQENQAILTDFGLALLTEAGTRGEILGSPHYLAPEQAISSAGVRPQSDLYAVGVILYEMFTGQLPFDAEDPLDIAMMQMTDPPRPPRQLRPELSVELEAVILKTLAKEPDDRYPNGAALADALDQALQLAPAETAAPAPGPAVPPPESRPAGEVQAESSGPATPAPASDPPMVQAGSSDQTTDRPPVPAAVASSSPAGKPKEASDLPPIPAAVAGRLETTATDAPAKAGAPPEAGAPAEADASPPSIASAMAATTPAPAESAPDRPTVPTLEESLSARKRQIMVIVAAVGVIAVIALLAGAIWLAIRAWSGQSAGEDSETSDRPVAVEALQTDTPVATVAAADSFSPPDGADAAQAGSSSPAGQETETPLPAAPPDTPTPTATATASDTPNATPRPATPTATPTRPPDTPTPTATGTNTPTTAPTRTPTATRTPAPVTATRTVNTPTATAQPATATRQPTAAGASAEASPTPTPTPTEIYRVAYTRWDGSKHSIWTVDLNGDATEPRFLVNYGASPSWSPDGERIAFFGEAGISGGSDGVWIMNGNGSGRRQILLNGTARSVAWAPTGNLIAYDAAPTQDDWRVYFIDANGTQIPAESLGEHPAWSPEAGQLVIRACRPNCGLWLINRDGSNPRQLTSEASDGLPAWSPDGATIAFQRNVGGNTDIFTINPNGDGLQQVTSVPGHDTAPVWTPDSGQIVFRTTRNGRWQIYRMNADGSDQSLLVDRVGGGNDWAFDRMAVHAFPPPDEAIEE